MMNFRQFQAGPYAVVFKWLQTAIALRHSDSVDVKFILTEGESRTEKTVALMHPDLLALSRETGRPLDDPWCARLAAKHLVWMVGTGEDMEKDLVTVRPDQLREYARELAEEERAEIAARGTR
jgi:hypothetical protein